VRNDTLFIFTADHGEYFGEHGMWGHGPPPFVQGTHIPLLLVGAGAGSGVRIRQNVQQLDILPTILEAVGLDPVPYPFQGRSLLPLAQGESAAVFTERLVFIEASSPGDVSFHLGNTHFVPKKNLVFDLSTDPLESSYLNEFTLDFGLKSLARRVASQYVRTYEALHHSMVPAAGDTVVVDPETLEQLREMGYIQ
jgi:arylsulfatase A-like enzyme